MGRSLSARGTPTSAGPRSSGMPWFTADSLLGQRVLGPGMTCTTEQKGVISVKPVEPASVYWPSQP